MVKTKTFKSKPLSMSRLTLLIWKNTNLLPQISCIISDFILENYRERIEYFVKEVISKPSKNIKLKPILEISKIISLKYIRCKGDNNQMEFYITDHISNRGRNDSFAASPEKFIAYLEDGYWSIPGRKKIKISPIILENINKWLTNMMTTPKD